MSDEEAAPLIRKLERMGYVVTKRQANIDPGDFPIGSLVLWRCEAYWRENGWATRRGRALARVIGHGERSVLIEQFGRSRSGHRLSRSTWVRKPGNLELCEDME